MFWSFLLTWIHLFVGYLLYLVARRYGQPVIRIVAVVITAVYEDYINQMQERKQQDPKFNPKGTFNVEEKVNG